MEATSEAKLLEAVRAGNVQHVQELIKSHPDAVKAADPHGWTALMVAVEGRNEAMVKLLLAAGADPHGVTESDRMNVLHVLAEQDHRNPAWQDKKGGKEGEDVSVAYSPIFEVLVKAGADPNATNAMGEGVLHLLCLRGHTEAVRWLLSRKLVSDINATNAHGDTALHYASRKGHSQIVDLLLAHGASPAHQSEFGTPPQVAGEFQQKDVASLLSGLARDQDAVGIWSLPPEVLVHLLSYLGTAEDLCAVSMACRAFAVVGRDESLWRPLGHPSWEQHHARTEEGWKGAYMTWLRAAAKRYRNKNASRFVHAPVAHQGQPAPTYSCIVKILLAGDHGVGKSSLLLRYADNTFSDQHISTIGVDFKIHMCDVSGELIKAQIWDTAGPERFRTITASYYRGANAIAIPYDITDRGSFEGVFRWWEEKQKYAHENAAVMLVGCKRDLADQRVVTEEEGRLRAAELGVLFAECSAKTGEGVQNAFDLLVEHVAGGWRTVGGMETPAYVPAEATFALYCGPAGADAGASPLQKAKKEAKCCLQ